MLNSKSIQKFHLYTTIFLHTLIYSASVYSTEVREINPPRLTRVHLGDKVLCHRPMRLGKPAMYVEEINGQIIAHNYGHGGSGWTLGPGAAQYVNDLLEIKIKAKNLNHNVPITVIGAGALGLFSALDLVERGYHNITIVAKDFNQLTSHNAGGLLAPVSMANDPEMEAIISHIGIQAYKFYDQIAKGTHPTFKKGAMIVSTYFQSREDSGLEPYVGVVMQPAKDVILDFKNGTRRSMVAYDDGIFINTPGLMKSLRNALDNKVQFVQREVNNFDQIKTPVLINCTGNGAKQLNSDDQMVSVQGHLIMLKDQNPDDINYMILTYGSEGIAESGHKMTRSFYIFPKSLHGAGPSDVGVLGGTFIEGADASTPNLQEFETLYNGALEFYGIKKKA